MFKACLPRHRICLQSNAAVHVTEIARVIAEQLKAAVPVDAGIRSEIVAVDGFKVVIVRPTVVIVVSLALDIVEQTVECVQSSMIVYNSAR